MTDQPYDGASALLEVIETDSAWALSLTPGGLIRLAAAPADALLRPTGYGEFDLDDDHGE